MTKKPIMLLIFDGWGLRDHGPGHAIQEAAPVQYLNLLENNPWIAIEASGEPVGLPAGQMGNSEVGHTTMGAGRILYMDLSRIGKALETGEFEENPVFQAAIAHAKKSQGTLHLMGLIGSGGVHSHQAHVLALIDLAKKEQVKKLNMHAFLDGRDVPPKSAEQPLKEIEEKLLAHDYSQIQTVSGRYYAMDRDQRWERTEEAYNNLTQASGTKHFLSLNALNFNYNDDITDEFIKPAVTDLTFEGIQDGDAVLFFNFRPDRARQIAHALTQPDFSGFQRKTVLNNLYFGCMSSYDEALDLPVAFPKTSPVNTLPQIISEKGLTQFRCAETEKYAHVTYFFNGGVETPFPGEHRELIASPKIATYDMQPEMSLAPVTEAVVKAIESQQYDLLVVNFANPDMVGHTGIEPAAIEAIQAVDQALGQVISALNAVEGTLILTADHGNIETMQASDGSPHTAHTTNKVPFILMSPDKTLKLDTHHDLGLSNIAPTILDLMGLPIPKEMTATSMLIPQEVNA